MRSAVISPDLTVIDPKYSGNDSDFDWDAAFTQVKVTADPELGRKAYLKVKNGQLAKYAARRDLHRRNVQLYGGAIAGLVLLAGFLAFGVPSILMYGWLNYTLDDGIGVTLIWLASLVLAVLAGAAIRPVIKLQRNEQKTAILLDQFIAELRQVLVSGEGFSQKRMGMGRQLPLPELKTEILRIETNFLNNDDELYTKKFIWTPYLRYYRDKLLCLQNQCLANGISCKPQPFEYISQVPAVWMQEDPLSLGGDDRDFVFKNWAIKQHIRHMYSWSSEGGGYTDNLIAINNIAAGDPIVFERMLRQKKISKGLKLFKRQVMIRYLDPAAKMRLVGFVDSVLAERPYVEQCDSMRELVLNKNAQIDMYTEQFWRVHRRSLKFYAFEILAGLLVIPLIVFSIIAAVNWGIIAGNVIFLIGAAALVYGEMALVTISLRDLKAKKLTPNLVSSLIAIRHNMSAESALADEQVYKYERAFKAAEKRFILTATEIEPVKTAKENVSDKVLNRLNAQMIQLRANKEAQAQVYYEKFNHYRRQCIKYGALEALIILLAIPVLVTGFALGYQFTALVGVEWVVTGVVVTVVVLLEVLAIQRHMVVARRKELYLLIYQKMAVLFSDYRLFSHPEYIAKELTQLEESIRRTAALDNIIDVDQHIGDISDVDLGTFDDTMWERLEVMQDSPAASTAVAPKQDATLDELIAPTNQPSADVAQVAATSPAIVQPISAFQHNQNFPAHANLGHANLGHANLEHPNFQRPNRGRQPVNAGFIQQNASHSGTAQSTGSAYTTSAMRRFENQQRRADQNFANRQRREQQFGNANVFSGATWVIGGILAVVLAFGALFAVLNNRVDAMSNFQPAASTPPVTGTGPAPANIPPTAPRPTEGTAVEIPAHTNALGTMVEIAQPSWASPDGYWTVVVESVQQVPTTESGVHPSAGHVWLEAYVTIGYQASDDTEVGDLWATVAFATADGYVLDDFMWRTGIEADRRLDTRAFIPAGQTISGYALLQVPADRWEDGFVLVNEDAGRPWTFFSIADAGASQGSVLDRIATELSELGNEANLGNDTAITGDADLGNDTAVTGDASLTDETVPTDDDQSTPSILDRIATELADLTD